MQSLFQVLRAVEVMQPQYLLHAAINAPNRAMVLGVLGLVKALITRSEGSERSTLSV